MNLPPKVKTGLMWLGIAFVAFALFHDPVGLAHVVRSVVDVLIQGAEAIGTFFNALLS